MHCGKPLKDETEEYCPDCGKRLAGKHVDSRNPQRSALDQGRSLWLHREPVSGALYRFKYRNRRRWGRIFAQELADRFAGTIRRWEIDAVIPVPLHPSRRRKRGFNQAEILAEELGKLCGIPVETDVLFRIRKTVRQTADSAAERRLTLSLLCARSHRAAEIYVRFQFPFILPSARSRSIS